MNRRTFLISSLGVSAYGGLQRRASRVLAQVLQALPEALRARLMRDPCRPQFHLVPAANWMNDPCAPRFFGGQYHMFFQYNPGAAVWGDMHWAHAVSPDLIHWKHLPVALSPTPNGYDAFGCFTGSVLPGADIPTILYTGVTKVAPAEETIRGEGLREVQCLATSTDPELRTWKKLEQPVLPAPPPGLHVTGFRDPCPWRDGDIWYLGVGSGFDKVGGAVLLYSSTDGRNWTYLHPLAQGKWNGKPAINPVFTGEMWECPDFFPLGDKHVLLYSTERNVYWEVGTFNKQDLRFQAENRGLLDHGAYYAMKSMLDARGRRILWGWVQETRPNDELKKAGWAGAMALPRVLSLGTNNELHMEVAPEFTSLIKGTQKLRATTNARELSAALARMPLRDRSGRIVLRCKTGAHAWGLKLTGEATSLFAVEFSGSADSKPAISVEGKTVSLTPDGEGISTLTLWLDGSILELFIDGKEAVTARCYALFTGDIHLVWTGEAQSLVALEVSQVMPISSDRLTT